MARGKSWKKEEDASLVRALVHVANQPADAAERRAPAFWARVTSQYVVFLANTDAPPRTAGAVETRWKNIQVSVARFVKCFTNASRAKRGDLQDADCVAAALKMYQEQDPKNDTFDHIEVWEYLRANVPRYEEFLHSTSNYWMLQKRKKRESVSVYDEEAALLANASGGGNAGSGASEAPLSRSRPHTGAVDAEYEGNSSRAPKRGRSPSNPADALNDVLSSAATVDVEKAKYRKAMLEAADTRNTLLAEQNAIAAEKNMIALFASRSDDISNEFFDLKRRIALSKLKREFPAF